MAKNGSDGLDTDISVRASYVLTNADIEDILKLGIIFVINGSGYELDVKHIHICLEWIPVEFQY